MVSQDILLVTRDPPHYMLYPQALEGRMGDEVLTFSPLPSHTLDGTSERTQVQKAKVNKFAVSTVRKLIG